MNDLKPVSTNKENKRTPWRYVILTMLGLAVGQLASVSPLHAQAPFDQGPSVNCDAPGADLQARLDGAPFGATVWVTGTCDRGPYLVSKNLEIREVKC